MSREQNLKVFRAVFEEGFSKGNVAVLDDLFSPDAREHQFGMPATVEGLKASITSLRSAFPDLTLSLEDVVAEGDKVWGRATARGTHRNLFMGIAPTNRQVAIQVFDVCRFENGQIVEHWGVPDRFALLAQLGALPRPPQAGGESPRYLKQRRNLSQRAAGPP
jgi:predicted ester cyclase